MTRMSAIAVSLTWMLSLAGASAIAQASPPAPAAPAPAGIPAAPGAGSAATVPPAAPPPASKDSLSVFFDTGSASLRPEDIPVLDQAARLYRAGQPILMILTASTDPTGSPIGNLQLSQQRAYTVLRGLVARGIPAQRFQILAKGETDPPVPAKPGQSVARDRQVEIAWR